MTGADPVAAPIRWQQAVIQRIVARTPRIASVFLQAPLNRSIAGQHVDVRLTADDGYQAQRSYSIASAPGGDVVELAIERLDDGEVSPYFHDVARPGDTIEVRGPIGGHFIWRASDGGPVLMVGGGSGVVPLVAIVRDWLTTQPGTPLMLVHSARTWDELAFRDELLDYEARRPEFTFVAITTRGPRMRATDFDRRLDPALLRELLTRWGMSARHVYACGSNAFVEAAAASLVAQRVPAAIIRTERYGGAS